MNQTSKAAASGAAPKKLRGQSVPAAPDAGGALPSPTSPGETPPGSAASTSASGGLTVDLSPPKTLKRLYLTNDRELQRELDTIQRTLADKKGDWKQRTNALQQMQGIVLGASETPHFDAREFSQQAVRVREALVGQVQDLRSAIVREACSLLFVLAHVLGSEFEPFALPALPVLFKATLVTIAVIAESSFQCICAIVRECRTQRVLCTVVDQHSSRNGILRWRCTQVLLLALQSFPAHTIERNADAIEALVRRALEDARDDVRAYGRQCFWAFHELLEERGSRLYARLDAKQQRILDDERPGKQREEGGGHLNTPCMASRQVPALQAESPSMAPEDSPKLAGSADLPASMLHTPPARSARPSPSPQGGSNASSRHPSRQSARRGAENSTATPAGSARGPSSSISHNEASTSRPARSSSKTQRPAARSASQHAPTTTAPAPGGRCAPTKIPTPMLTVTSSFPHRKADSRTSTASDSRTSQGVPESTSGGASAPSDQGFVPDEERASTAESGGGPQKPNVADLLSGCGLSPQRSTLRALALAARTEASESWEKHFGRVLLIVLDSLARPEPHGVREAALLCLQEMVVHQSSFFNDFAEVVAARLFELCQIAYEDKWITTTADHTLERLMGIVDPTRALEITLPVMSTSGAPVLQVTLRLLPVVLQCLEPAQVLALLDTVLPSVIAALSAQSTEVRKAAVFCLVDIYFIVGEEVMSYLDKELSASQLKLLLMYIGRQQRERDELNSVNGG